VDKLLREANCISLVLELGYHDGSVVPKIVAGEAKRFAVACHHPVTHLPDGFVAVVAC
jgi:hypothetical protein